MKSLDISQEKFNVLPKMPAVLRPKSRAVAGIKGNLPARSGDVILTKKEKEELKSKFGWKEGNPLPGNIAQRITDARKSVAKEIRTAKPAQDLPILKQPKECDINQLDPDKQAELRKFLGEFGELAPELEAATTSQAETGQLAPSIQQALYAAGEGVEVIDSRLQDPTIELQRRLDEVEGRKPTIDLDETGLEPPEDEPAAIEVDESKITPTSEDLKAYVTAILGGVAFTKEYSLLGGKIKFVFEQPSTAVAENVLTQLAQEISNQSITSQEAIRRASLYRLLVSLRTVKTESLDGLTGIMFDLGEYPDIKLAASLAAAMKRYPLTIESVWNLCRKCSNHFHDLIATIDEMAEKPDFLSVIEK